ncbi:MAG TPA: sulfatase, partial [Actinomycetota bacterium]|nr:sulfatase [Actinomycetota bacterium]
MPPDLVVVLCDTARADAFRPWGGPQPTPTMERLAREGVRYSDAIAAAPWTLPSITSIFSGRLPSQHGVTNECVEWVNDNPTSPDRSIRAMAGPWLPEELKARGYRTWAASCNIWISTWGGYDRGFDRFVDLQDNVRLPQGRWGRFARKAMRVGGRADRGGRATTQEFRRALAEPDPAPLFAFVNLMEVHTPLNPPRPYYPYPPWRRASTLRLSGASKGDRPFLVYTLGVAEPPPEYTTTLRTLYYGSARYEDALLGSFVQAIEERGRPTVLVVVSDHGENLGERGLYGHHSSLSEELLQVPLAAWGHRVDVAAGPVDGPVSLLGLSSWLTGLADGDGAPLSPQDTVVSEYE